VSTAERCAWPGQTPLYVAYHDEEWGVPEWDSQQLFEKLILDGFQAGLSWITILKKRDNFRAAFDGFDPAIIAQYDDTKIESLLDDAGIVRHRGKIVATIGNAKAYLAIQSGGQSFSEFLWQFVDHVPRQNNLTSTSDIPAQTDQSVAMSKALKKVGFKFCGPTICYAFMQAVGMVNDHTITCFRHKEIVAIAGQSMP
jgi:DNA-3-methyladenine glycosylase I